LPGDVNKKITKFVDSTTKCLPVDPSLSPHFDSYKKGENLKICIKNKYIYNKLTPC
jgi:hypothetical protein